MKSFKTLEDRQLSAPDAYALEHDVKDFRQAKLAALLSLVPGLGQIKNGETGKGLLFLAVAGTNLLLLALLLNPEYCLQAVNGLIKTLSPQSQWNLAPAFNVARNHSLVAAICGALMLSFMVFASRDAYDKALKISQGRRFAKFFLGLSEATSGSYLMHVALTLASLTIILLCYTPKPPAAQITDIVLEQPEPPPPPMPEPPAPKKKEEVRPEKVEVPKKKEVQKPVEVKKVSVPTPTPVAVAVPTDQPTTDNVVQSSEPAAESGSTSAAGGSGEGSADGSGEGSDVDFNSYLAEVQKRIKKAWFPPRGNESKSITVKFKIRKDGSVRSVKLVSSSGVAIADQAAKDAVANAAPFPALPSGSGDEIDIRFTFDYNVFSGKGAAPF